MPENGWREYQRLVLAQLEEHGDGIARVDANIQSLRSNDLADIKIEIAMLRVKASIWGAGSGLVISGIVSALIGAMFGGK